MKKQESEKLKNNPYVIYGIGVLTAIVIFFLVVGISIYAFGITNETVEKVAGVVPYPGAIIGFQKGVSIGKLNNDLQAVRKFYENQDFSELGLRIDFSTEDGEKRLKIKEKQLLNKLIENKVVEILARKNEVLLTSEMVDQELERKLVEYGGEEKFNIEVLSLYGWDIEDFKREVVEPALQREKLEKALKQTDSSYKEAYSKMEKAKETLDAGVSFEEVAKEYSEGKTAPEGGLLGWYSVSQMVPEVGATVLFLEKNQPSDIIESPLGYHIIKFDEIKEENDRQFFQIHQIFVPTTSFAKRLSEESRNITVLIPLKDYFWDKEKGLAEFKDSSLREFEKSILENPLGDPIFIY